MCAINGRKVNAKTRAWEDEELEEEGGNTVSNINSQQPSSCQAADPEGFSGRHHPK